MTLLPIFCSFVLCTFWESEAFHFEDFLYHLSTLLLNTFKKGFLSDNPKKRRMAVSSAGGSGGGRRGSGPPPKYVADLLGDLSDEEDEDEDPDYTDREFCSTCNKYLRIGQTLAVHRKKSCIGPRGLVGEYPCRFPSCDSRYRHFHDLQAHWRRVHPGVKQPKSMSKYIP